MIEIKFRAKSIDEDEWVYGYYVYFQCNDNHIIFLNNSSTLGRDYDNVRVKPETLGRYVGVKDKNDKEIYEGDIVEKENHRNGKSYIERYIVIFDEGMFCLKGVNSNELYEAGYLITFSNKEKIIDNIYDNPELLKDNKS